MLIGSILAGTLAGLAAAVLSVALLGLPVWLALPVWSLAGSAVMLGLILRPHLAPPRARAAPRGLPAH